MKYQALIDKLTVAGLVVSCEEKTFEYGLSHVHGTISSPVTPRKMWEVAEMLFDNVEHETVIIKKKEGRTIMTFHRSSDVVVANIVCIQPKDGGEMHGGFKLFAI